MSFPILFLILIAEYSGFQMRYHLFQYDIQKVFKRVKTKNQLTKWMHTTLANCELNLIFLIFLDLQLPKDILISKFRYSSGQYGVFWKLQVKIPQKLAILTYSHYAHALWWPVLLFDSFD